MCSRLLAPFAAGVATEPAGKVASGEKMPASALVAATPAWAFPVLSFGCSLIALMVGAKSGQARHPGF